MKTHTKALGFIIICILIGATAKIAPHKQITIASLEEVKQSETTTSTPKPKVNVNDLLQQYRSRPLFTSSLENAADIQGEVLPGIVEDWSPLDYQLIGVSRAANLTTGWFRHIETGELVSSRRGMQLGNWTLDYLSGTEARLTSKNKTESLKLFHGEEPR